MNGCRGRSSVVHESEIAEPFLGRPISAAAVRLSRSTTPATQSVCAWRSFRIIADIGMWRRCYQVDKFIRRGGMVARRFQTTLTHYEDHVDWKRQQPH